MTEAFSNPLIFFFTLLVSSVYKFGKGIEEESAV